LAHHFPKTQRLWQAIASGNCPGKTGTDPELRQGREVRICDLQYAICDAEDSRDGIFRFLVVELPQKASKLYRGLTVPVDGVKRATGMAREFSSLKLKSR
jgi:hypothetical protein